MRSNITLTKPNNLPGRMSMWQHKKGTFYRVAIVSRHSERPNEWLVTYEPLVGGDPWTRSMVFTHDNQWPGFADDLGDKMRFTYISGPRTWRDEPPLPRFYELLEILDNVSASASNMHLQFESQMQPEDRRNRGRLIQEARDLCDSALR